MKKRKLQIREFRKIENQLIEESFEKANKVWNNVSKDNVELERLDHCQAWIYKTIGYSFLVSYNTLVAFIDNNCDMYDVSRLVHGHTATSEKHIAIFRNKFSHVCEYTWREV